MFNSIRFVSSLRAGLLGAYERILTLSEIPIFFLLLWNILIFLVRLRLREEVDVLKHLSQAALSSIHSADGRHPNVLAYLDSWEEDEALYICTELCESGNLGWFLWEYGRVFPRLDEARVWKVIVDLSNVSITI